MNEDTASYESQKTAVGFALAGSYRAVPEMSTRLSTIGRFIWPLGDGHQRERELTPVVA